MGFGVSDWVATFNPATQWYAAATGEENEDPTVKAYKRAEADPEAFYGIGGDLGDLLRFQSHEGKNVWQNLQDNPERAFLGSADPMSTKLWNSILGTEERSLVNEWGGPTDYDYKTAQDRGMDTQSPRAGHALAQMIAKSYASKATGGLTSLLFSLGNAGVGGWDDGQLNKWLSEEEMYGYQNPNRRGPRQAPTKVAGGGGGDWGEWGDYIPASRGVPTGTVSGGTRLMNDSDDDDRPINQGWDLNDIWQRMKA